MVNVVSLVVIAVFVEESVLTMFVYRVMLTVATLLMVMVFATCLCSGSCSIQKDSVGYHFKSFEHNTRRAGGYGGWGVSILQVFGMLCGLIN